MKNNYTISEQGEVLILPDGKILAHNITPEIAEVLSALDPDNDLMRQRAKNNGAPVSKPALDQVARKVGSETCAPMK